VANDAVLWWGGRLLALWDGGQPYKLDPLSLGTAGATDVSLTVPKKEAFGSRPRADTTISNGGSRLVGFGVKPSGGPLLGGATNVRVFEYEEDFSTDVTLSGTAVNGGKLNSADCVMTNTWAIFAVSPPDDDAGAERGARGVFDALGGKGLGALFDQSGGLSSPSSPLSPPSHSPACFVFLRREAKQEALPIYVDLGAGVHVQHFINAFEGDVDGLVTVDFVATDEAWPRPLGKKKSWAELDYASDVSKARLVRYKVDLRRPEVCEEQNNPRRVYHLIE
jgi:carotenoid cleavage dioxygenase-like enzyme